MRFDSRNARKITQLRSQKLSHRPPIQTFEGRLRPVPKFVSSWLRSNLGPGLRRGDTCILEGAARDFGPDRSLPTYDWIGTRGDMLMLVR